MSANISRTNDPKNRYILIVESKTADLFHCSMLLQRFGYRVCTANTAGQALDMLSVAMPALVIADLFLPGMNGIDLLDMIRQDARTSSLPVLFLTPVDDEAAQRRSLAAGITRIPKPIQAEQLYRVVQAAIETTPRTNIRIQTRLSISVNSIPLDSIEGECASVLSEHGMYVRMLKPYERNERLAIEMNINGRIIPADVLVLYSHQFGEGPFIEPGMGLKFLALASEDNDFIRAFIHDEVTRGIIPTNV